MSDTHAPAPAASNGHGLGLAGWMAKTFIHSPLSPLLFFAMLGMGLLGLIATPRQEDPQISVPMIDVFVQFPGASTEQVVSLAVEPLERLLSEIPGVKHVYSASEREQGIITVRSRWASSWAPPWSRSTTSSRPTRTHCPRGHAAPGAAQGDRRRARGDPDPVVRRIDDAALRSLGHKLLQSLAQIPNTGQGFVVGGRSEQIRVEVEPQRLSGFGVTLDTDRPDHPDRQRRAAHRRGRVGRAPLHRLHGLLPAERLGRGAAGGRQPRGPPSMCATWPRSPWPRRSTTSR
jgi:hypothetical protein